MRLSTSQQLQRAFAAIEARASSGSNATFAARAAALERLDVHVLDRLRHVEEVAGLPAPLQALRARAVALREGLEASSERVARRLRRRIASGRYSPAGLRRAFHRTAGAVEDPASRGGYDTLDLLVGRLLDAGIPPEEPGARAPERIDYQPTPARAVLSLIDRAHLGPDDVVYDLGSGLGQVVILVALLTRARAAGIELERAYCEYARRSARALNVPDVEFVQADAANAHDASLASGTVYFMYTPFRGAPLRKVMERLRVEAAERPIRICTVGPCTADVASATWLAPAGPRQHGEHEVAVFRSVA